MRTVLRGLAVISLTAALTLGTFWMFIAFSSWGRELGFLASFFVALWAMAFVWQIAGLVALFWFAVSWGALFLAWSRPSRGGT
jgi:hypothetical protein